MNFLHSRRNVEILGATKLHARFVSSQKIWLGKIYADAKSPQLSILEGWFLPIFFAKDPTKTAVIPCKQTKALEGQRCMHWLGKDLVAPDLTPGVLDQQKSLKPVFCNKKFHRNLWVNSMETNSLVFLSAI